MIHHFLRTCALLFAGIAFGIPATAQNGYWLQLEEVTTHTSGTLDGMTTYRLYLNTVNATDYLSSCSGDADNPMVFESSSGSWYNSPLSATWNASGVNPALFPLAQELAYDSFLTIGAESSDDSPHPQSIWGSIDPTEEFDGNGDGNNVTVDDNLGGVWFSTFPGLGDVDVHPGFGGDDLRILVAQFTTAGTMSGQIQIQVFKEGVQSNELRELFPFSSDDAEFFGCTDELALNFDPGAAYDDGSCEYASIDGCTDEAACNYDAAATTDDGSCVYPEANYDCEGNCLQDVDNDGVCDPVDDCVGALDECGVCNGPGAVFECGCTELPEGDCDCDGSQQDALGDCGGGCFADADADGICDDVDDCVGALDACGVCNGPGEIYDCGCDDLPAGDCDCNGNQLDAVGVCGGTCLVDDNANGICDDQELGGCTDETACNYDASATIDDGTCEFESCDGVCCDPTSPNYDPAGCVSSGDVIGDPDCAPDEVGGCTVEQACNYNPEATVDDGSCDFTSCLNFGCTDDTACNYDPDAQFNDGSCVYANFPYDCAGDCVNDEDGDGVCNEFEVPGCTDEAACNYDEAATDDNGTCQYLDALGICGGDCQEDANANGVCDIFEVSGCTDANACNYVPLASLEDGSCLYPEANYDCDGNCLDDVDGDGVCDVDEVPGCTDQGACNYNEEATDDDGSCEFESCVGCTDQAACNYDAAATIDDGTCEYPPDFLDCDGHCLNDADGDGVCDELEVVGCQDETACNYNEDATDEGDCEYAEEFYDCDGNCLNDADGDGVCDELELAGCTDADACNYDDEATDDNDSCEFPGDPCDDGDEATINDALNESCECEGEVEDGVEEATFSFEMYPNPASSVLNVTVEGLGVGSNAFVTLRSSTGQLIQQMPCRGKLDMDVRGLASGLYFLSVGDANTPASTKPVLIATKE